MIRGTEEESTAEITSVTTINKDSSTGSTSKRTKKALKKKKRPRETWKEHTPIFNDEGAWNLLYEQVGNGWIPIAGNGRVWKYAAFQTLGGQCSYKFGKPYNIYPPIPQRSDMVSIFKSYKIYKSGTFAAF